MSPAITLFQFYLFKKNTFIIQPDADYRRPSRQTYNVENSLFIYVTRYYGREKVRGNRRCLRSYLIRHALILVLAFPH